MKMRKKCCYVSCKIFYEMSKKNISNLSKIKINRKSTLNNKKYDLDNFQVHRVIPTIPSREKLDGNKFSSHKKLSGRSTRNP